jgi:hypothetical protein
VVLNHYKSQITAVYTTVLKISKISIRSGGKGARGRRDENVKGPGVTHNNYRSDSAVKDAIHLF